MGRLNIANLPKAGQNYRVDHHPAPPANAMGKSRHQFECRSASNDEDLDRAASCGLAKSPLFAPRSARKLARKLGRHKRPKSLASYRWWRRFRIRLVGALWKLIEEGPWDHRLVGQVSVFSIAPCCWEFTPEQLDGTSGQLLMAQLRTWLNRAGAADADGFLLACLHGEWLPTRGIYRVHVHGVATGGMIAVLRELRDHRELQRDQMDQSGLAKPPARIVISRKPIDNLAHTLSYQFKGYWPSRWIGPVGETGTIKRARKGSRIAEPHHTELLLWLDRQRFQDITLLMNLRVGNQGLVITPKPSNRSKS